MGASCGPSYWAVKYAEELAGYSVLQRIAKESKMEKMSQPGTDKGERGETGEREPKGADRIDREGSRSRIDNGVAMGKEDRPRNGGPMDMIHEKTSAKGDGHAMSHKREYDKSKY